MKAIGKQKFLESEDIQHTLQCNKVDVAFERVTHREALKNYKSVSLVIMS